MTEQKNQLASLFAACWKDETLKARLMADPKTVLVEYGMDVPDGMEVKVVENADNCVHITIPSAQFTINLLTELASSQWTWLFAACRKDESLKARFMADPKAVLAEHGLDVPDGMEVKVVENADNCVHITIPSVTFWKTRIGVQLHAIQLVDCLSPF